MSDNDVRIEILQQKLADSNIPPAERDALADDLRLAQQINGSTDPVQQMLKTMSIQNIRREMLAHERVAAHYANCPMMSQVTKNPDGTMTMPWDKMSKDSSSDTSSISCGMFTLRGPVVRITVFSVIIMTFVWLLINRNDQSLRKDMRETILPAVIQSIKAEAQHASAEKGGTE